ncbi:putative ribonuclease H-like domain-containing protein [Tanacetum coccineum]
MMLMMQLKLSEKSLPKILRICFFKQELLKLAVLTILDPKYPKKSGYRRGTIIKTLFLKKDKNDIMLVQVYVDDIIFGSTNRSWCDEFEAFMKCRFQMSSMGELTFFLGLQVKQKEDGIFISQDKYVAEILKKFDFASVKTASTPIETQKPLVKDEKASDVDVHLYRSMIGSLMYLTASRPDIMFAVCACSRRLISWQCKKQIIMATSTTEAEYVVAANCCGQNPVFHSKTKHIVIRHHFIRDAYEKKLIQVLKIHTDDNVADLLTKAFDVSRDMTEFRGSLRRGTDGTETLLIPTLFILCLDKVSTDSANLVPLGKVCTALESKMAVLDSCPKHNMVAYLEKSEGNAEFHEIIDFLKRSLFIMLSQRVNTFSGKVTPLFATMLVQPTQDEGASLGRPSEALPTPSPAPTSEIPLEPQPDSSPAQTSEVPIEHQPTLSPRPSPTTTIPDSIPETSSENLGGHFHTSDRSLSGMRFGSQWNTENAQDEGRTREIVDEDKEIEENVLSTDKEGVSTDIEKVSTDRPIVSTDGSKVSTDKQIEGTDEQVEGTEEQNEDTVENFEGTEENIEGTKEKVESTDGHKKGTEEEIAAQATQTPTSKIFGDDETIAKFSSHESIQSRFKRKGKGTKKDKGKEEDEEEDESKVDLMVFLKLRRSLSSLKVMNRLVKDKADRLLAEKLRTRKRAIYNRRKSKIENIWMLCINLEEDIFQDEMLEVFDRVHWERFDGVHTLVTKEGSSHSYACREEVSFEKGSTDADAEIEVRV